MKKLLLTLVIAILAMSFAVIPAFAELNPDDIADDAILYELDMDNSSVYVDFEGGMPSDYTHSLADLGIQGISFVDSASYIKVVEGEEALSGESSFQAKGYLDARIWSLTLLDGDGDYIFVEVLFKPICMDGTGGFGLAYDEPDLGNDGGTESGSGWLFQVTKDQTSGEIRCLNRQKKVMAVLEEGKTYKLAVAFPVGEKSYDFFVDGVRVATENRWLGEVNGLAGFRIDMYGPGYNQPELNAENTLEWAIDDLIITYGNEISKEQYFATPAPTAEPTATPEPVPTEDPSAPTTAPAEPTKAPKEKSGCGSVVVSSAIVSMMTVLAAAVVLKKKH